MKLRVWKLGSLEHRISPTPAAFQRLREALLEAQKGQIADIIWDATLDVEVHELGSECFDVATRDFVMTPELRSRIEQAVAREIEGVTAPEDTVNEIAGCYRIVPDKPK